MTDEEIVERLKHAILISVPDGVVGVYHATIYARAALAEMRRIEEEQRQHQRASRPTFC